MLPALGFGLGALGAGLGLHALGLGQFLEPLDYPRQAAWNLLRSGGNALSGQGTWEDALRAVPGALGAGVGAGLMATGVGAPLGILAGSLAGGAAQGLGRMSSPESFQAPAVSQLTGTEEFVPNLLAGMLTDPLTYAGGFAGRKAMTAPKVLSEEERTLQALRGVPGNVEASPLPVNWMDDAIDFPQPGRGNVPDPAGGWGHGWLDEELTGQLGLSQSGKYLGQPIPVAASYFKRPPTPGWKEPHGAVMNASLEGIPTPDIESAIFSVKPDFNDFSRFGAVGNEVYSPMTKELNDIQFHRWLRDTVGWRGTQTPDYQLFKQEVTVPGQTIMPPQLPPPNLNLAAQPPWVQSLAANFLPPGEKLAAMPPQAISEIMRLLQGELHPRSFETLARAVFPGFDPAMLQTAGQVDPLLVRPPVVNWVPRDL